MFPPRLLSSLLPLLLAASLAAAYPKPSAPSGGDPCGGCTFEKALQCLVPDPAMRATVGDAYAELGEQYLNMAGEGGDDAALGAKLDLLDGLLNGSRGSTGLNLSAITDRLDAHHDLKGKNFDTLLAELGSVDGDLHDDDSPQQPCGREGDCDGSPKKSRQRRFIGNLFGASETSRTDNTWRPFNDLQQQLHTILLLRGRGSSGTKAIQDELSLMEMFDDNLRRDRVIKIAEFLKQTYGENYTREAVSFDVSLALNHEVDSTKVTDEAYSNTMVTDEAYSNRKVTDGVDSRNGGFLNFFKNAFNKFFGRS